MGTLVAVRKGAEICIATNGHNHREPWLRGGNHATPHCIIKFGESYIGLASSVAYQTAFEVFLASFEGKKTPALLSRQELYTFFTVVHEHFRNNLTMATTFQGGQEFEWTPMNALVVNRSGIYRVDSSRGVYEFYRYWAFGSGEAFALGALHTCYDEDVDAITISRKALAAATAFDGTASIEPIIYSIKVPTLIMTKEGSNTTRARRERSKTIKLPSRSS